MLTSLPVLIITRCKAPTAWPAWAGDVGRLVARCACVAAGGPSAMGSCPVVQQLYGRLDAVGEELIGQVAVCARPGELQRAEHQSEEGQRVGWAASASIGSRRDAMSSMTPISSSV